MPSLSISAAQEIFFFSMPAHESKGNFSKSQQKNFKRTMFHKQQCSSVAIQPFRTGSAPAEAYLYQDYCALSSSHPMCPCVPVPFLTLLVSDRTKQRETEVNTFQKQKILSFGNITVFNCFACLLGFSCSLHHEPLPLLALGLPGGTTSFGTRQKVLIGVYTSHSSGFSASPPPAKPPSWELIPAKTHSWQYRVEEKEGLREMLHPFLLVNFYMIFFVHEKMKMKSK